MQLQITATFLTKKERIRDQFIYGLNNDDLIEKVEILYLSCNGNFTLEMVIEYCKSYIEIKTDRKPIEQDVARIVQRKQIQSKCNYCGFSHEKRKCPAYNKTCNTCGIKNHFSSVCRGKENQNTENEVVAHYADSEEEDGNKVAFLGRCSTTDNDGRKWIIHADVNKNPDVKFKVDTGADVTVINSETYDGLARQPKLLKSDRKLKSPGGFIKLRGMFHGTIKYKENIHHEAIYVLEQDNTTINLLSRKASEYLRIVQFLGSVAANEEIFRFGKWQTTPVKPELLDNVKPHATYAPRKVPLPLLPAVQETLEAMERDGIIERVITPT